MTPSVATQRATLFPPAAAYYAPTAPANDMTHYSQMTAPTYFFAPSGYQTVCLCTCFVILSFSVRSLYHIVVQFPDYSHYSLIFARNIKCVYKITSSIFKSKGSIVMAIRNQRKWRK